MVNRRQLFLALAVMAMSPPAYALETPDDGVEFAGKIGDGKARTVTLAEIRTLPKVELTAHTPWYDGAVHFEGVRARDLMRLVGAKGGEAAITALDGYAIKVPMSDFQAYDAIFAYRIDGKDLTVDTKGPLFLIYPFDQKPELANENYYARCIWQIAKIDIK